MVLTVSGLLGLLNSKAVLEDNGYRELVVAISPDVPESQETLDNIKNLMTEASRELFIASRKRAYYKTIKILLPQTWSNTPTDQQLQGEFFEAAEVRVDQRNPVYDTAPYTVRGSECGQPGSYIHITPEFLVDSSAYGNWGKVVVHEWAKLRWGVFEEHGYPGDEQFPMFFYKVYIYFLCKYFSLKIYCQFLDNLHRDWAQAGVDPQLLCQQPTVRVRAGHQHRG